MISTRIKIIVASMALVFSAGIAHAQDKLTPKAAPALEGTWLHATPAQQAWPKTGQVTLLHFWTLGCINCKHNLPLYNNLQAKFAGKPVSVVGVHYPEFDWERPIPEIESAIKKHAINYPVVADEDGATWAAYRQQYWPTVYLVDKQGRLRYKWVGELNYGDRKGEEQVAKRINELLAE